MTWGHCLKIITKTHQVKVTNTCYAGSGSSRAAFLSAAAKLALESSSSSNCSHFCYFLNMKANCIDSKVWKVSVVDFNANCQNYIKNSEYLKIATIYRNPTSVGLI